MHLPHIAGIYFHPIITMIPSLPAVAHQHFYVLGYLFASHLHYVERAKHIEAMYMLDADY